MALIFLTLGIVLAFSIQESLPEEITLDKWDPVTPSTLSPQNETGWAYTELTKGGSFLKLNVTASDEVRLIIGEPSYSATEEETWTNVIFNQSGTSFTQEVAIAGTAASFLEIDNEGTTPVNLSGNVKKIGNTYQTVYPYSSLGTLVILVGSILLIYGIFTLPKKRHLKGKLERTYHPERARFSPSSNEIVEPVEGRI
jgi:hypothetical protein